MFAPSSLNFQQNIAWTKDFLNLADVNFVVCFFASIGFKQPLPLLYHCHVPEP